jgi:hypothetical protein
MEDVVAAGTGAFGARSLKSSSRARRQSATPEIETEAQEIERQYRDASTWIRCPPTSNEIPLPA